MRIGVVGATGRMGRALVRAVAEHPSAELVAASVREGSPQSGADAGSVAGVAALGVPLEPQLAVLSDAEAVLDFTTPGTSTALATRLAEAGVVHVIGTTGFSPQDEAVLAHAAERIAIVKSGNMSLGVNLLASLVGQAAKALPDADIEILEMHHRRKVDAPSGTALLLGEAAAQGRGVSLADEAVFSRHGETGPRASGAIGFAALRGGTVVGMHDVVLALDSERIVLSHVAEDRAIFANGAVAAALWAAGKPPGLYSMADVLGLS